MSDSPIPSLRYALLALMVVLSALVVFLYRGEPDDVVSQETTAQYAEAALPAPETEVQMTAQPEPSPVEPETQTKEPTEEAELDVKTTPSVTQVLEVNEMEEFVSVTEFFRVMVPAGWSLEETFPGGAIVMANSEAALDRFNSDSAIESGDVILNIGFLPYELFRQREVVPLDIQFEATPDVFLQSLLPMFRIADNAVLSDPELVSLSVERDAGLLTVTEEGREGLILMFEAGDQVVAFVSAIGFPDELDSFQEITYAVSADLAFRGAQEALYGALLGG